MIFNIPIMREVIWNVAELILTTIYRHNNIEQMKIENQYP